MIQRQPLPGGHPPERYGQSPRPSEQLARSKASLGALTQPRQRADFAEAVRRHPGPFAAGAFVAGLVVGGWSWPRAIAKAGIIWGIKNVAVKYVQAQLGQRR